MSSASDGVADRGGHEKRRYSGNALEMEIVHDSEMDAEISNASVSEEEGDPYNIGQHLGEFFKLRNRLAESQAEIIAKYGDVYKRCPPPVQSCLDIIKEELTTFFKVVGDLQDHSNSVRGDLLKCHHDYTVLSKSRKKDKTESIATSGKLTKEITLLKNKNNELRDMAKSVKEVITEEMSNFTRDKSQLKLELIKDCRTELISQVKDVIAEELSEIKAGYGMLKDAICKPPISVPLPHVDTETPDSNTYAEALKQGVINNAHGTDAIFPVLPLATRKRPRYSGVLSRGVADTYRSTHIIPSRGGDGFVISASSDTYAATLKRIKENVELGSLVESIQMLRQTKNGNILIKTTDNISAETIANKVQVALGDDTNIRKLEKIAVIEVLDIDCTTSEEEVNQALQSICKLPIKKCTVSNARPGVKKARLVISTTDATRLLEAGRIRIGWCYCKIRLAQNLNKCYKCLQSGHLAANCGSQLDMRRCYRCGQSGHIAKDCTKSDNRREGTKVGQEISHAQTVRTADMPMEIEGQLAGKSMQTPTQEPPPAKEAVQTIEVNSDAAGASGSEVNTSTRVAKKKSKKLAH